MPTLHQQGTRITLDCATPHEAETLAIAISALLGRGIGLEHGLPPQAPSPAPCQRLENGEKEWGC